MRFDWLSIKWFDVSFLVSAVLFEILYVLFSKYSWNLIATALGSYHIWIIWASIFESDSLVESEGGVPGTNSCQSFPNLCVSQYIYIGRRTDPQAVASGQFLLPPYSANNINSRERKSENLDHYDQLTTFV